MLRKRKVNTGLHLHEMNVAATIAQCYALYDVLLALHCHTLVYDDTQYCLLSIYSTHTRTIRVILWLTV